MFSRNNIYNKLDCNNSLLNLKTVNSYALKMANFAIQTSGYLFKVSLKIKKQFKRICY